MVPVSVAGIVCLSGNGTVSQVPLCRCSEADRTGTLPSLFYPVQNAGGQADFFRVLLEQERKPLDPMELVYPNEVPVFEKYDEYLPEELVKKGFACGVLGIDEMRERIRGWEMFA